MLQIPARWRLPLLAGSASLLLLASILIAARTESAYRAQVVQATSVQARILGQTATAALSFGDHAQTQGYVDALRANPEIEAAAIYGEDGARVAGFGATPESSARVTGARAVRSGDKVVSVAPVAQSGVPLGSVYLRTRAEPLDRRLARYAGPGLLVVLATLMFAALGVYARALGRAYDDLRKETEQRARVEAALRQSQKMEAVGRLTGGIAHDFNNMLAIIIGSLDLLRRRWTPDDPKIERLVDGALDGARRAADITQRLLAFSRQQPLDPKPTDIAKAVKNVSALLGRTLGEAISVETVAAGGLWPAFIDAPQLESAILNLAINARDAMPNGGKLTIECGNAFLDQNYTAGHENLKPGQYVMVAVSDTGTGIPAEVVSKIFDPFFTTKPSGVGTGLGLSQVHGFIKQSGGHVAVYSELGVGTTIKLYLPRSDAPLLAQPSEARRVNDARRRDVTVLIVEDEGGVRNFTAEAAAELGYDTLIAASPQEAIEAFESHPEIAILLTDVIMPEMNGRQLAERLQGKKAELQVLFMTGYTQNAIVHNGMLDPGTRLLTKPFTVEDLARALDLEVAALSERSASVVADG
jgi:signal transduction histidine kinase/CheY-like chemotaxis protein